MPVPDFQSLMLPVLKAAMGKPEIDMGECRQTVAAKLKLTPYDLAELLPSGRQNNLC